MKDTIEKGNLVYHKRPTASSGTEWQPTLIRCPLCGEEFGNNKGSKRSNHFLTEHTPEDFGL
jgi:hypothetical protein